MPNDQFYIDKRDITAHALINKRGFAMTLVGPLGGSTDSDTGVHTPGTPTNTAVVGVMRFFSQDEINNIDVLSGDAQALISAKETAEDGIEPDTEMRLIVNGVTYNIVRNTPTMPGGIAIMYRLQIRR